MATTSFKINGIKGRTSSNRRFVVVDVRPDLDRIDILFRTDSIGKALDRAAKERAFIVDTIGVVKVRRPGTSTWEDAG